MIKQKEQNGLGFFASAKTLFGSVREYKKASILSPLFVAMEVVLECLIPWFMSLLLEALNFLSGQLEQEKLSGIVRELLYLLDANGRPPLINTILTFG